VKYSERELEVFNIIKQHSSRIHSSDLTAKFWKGKPNKPPINYHQVVMGVLTTLIKKVNHNKESFVVKKSPSRGPHGITAWIEKR
jgi:hypothetical protein